MARPQLSSPAEDIRDSKNPTARREHVAKGAFASASVPIIRSRRGGIIREKPDDLLVKMPTQPTELPTKRQGWDEGEIGRAP